LITELIPADRRDKANGLFSTATGISFGINSVASGLILGFGGMFWVLIAGIVLTLLSIVYLAFIPLSEEKLVRTETEKREKGQYAQTDNWITIFNPDVGFRTQSKSDYTTLYFSIDRN